ncbi:hypothetical protein K431DRAFT_68737 [Polychaeton citri CBS 116435]|uniref:Uncharacterized protein n=1 Tax=Polychaeton citri CBS 116435 TaxID=1314669 RepID=A0A9P4Q6M2_9PEZI|nr:hypothetical protein K431DRAFT_68737 [Polychaeton citri CBS 116435]
MKAYTIRSYKETATIKMAREAPRDGSSSLHKSLPRCGADIELNVLHGLENTREQGTKIKGTLAVFLASVGALCIMGFVLAYSARGAPGCDATDGVVCKAHRQSGNGRGSTVVLVA